MNPTRKRRMAFALVLLAAAAVAGAFIVLALQENLTYLHTPTDVRAGAVPADARFRLGGVVCEGSIRRTDGTLDVHFAVTDRIRQVPVRYHGILPDMFREGTSIIATGRLQGNEFVAGEVLAKHDETYMPREVAEAMAKGMALKTKTCGAN
ncbi:MAG: cytochrome c maturation protein CcmE [Arenimonas sp.]|jgi:cytochrome c-type biogenesis protein CcmE